MKFTQRNHKSLKDTQIQQRISKWPIGKNFRRVAHWSKIESQFIFRAQELTVLYTYLPYYAQQKLIFLGVLLIETCHFSQLYGMLYFLKRGMLPKEQCGSCKLSWMSIIHHLRVEQSIILAPNYSSCVVVCKCSKI